MKIENLDVADGQIQEMTSNAKDLCMIFLDWKERLWHLRFDNIVAVENFNIENEDLIDLIIESDNDFITLAMDLTEEDDITVFCYSFFPRHAEKARLRIVATSCEVEAIAP